MRTPRRLSLQAGGGRDRRRRRARSEAAWANLHPRVDITARYTPSQPPPPSFTFGPISSPGFPVIVDNLAPQATIAIPSAPRPQDQRATRHAEEEEAARFDIQTARAKSFSDGKIAWYTWLRALARRWSPEQSLPRREGAPEGTPRTSSRSATRRADDAPGADAQPPPPASSASSDAGTASLHRGAPQVYSPSTPRTTRSSSRATVDGQLPAPDGREEARPVKRTARAPS